VSEHRSNAVAPFLAEDGEVLVVLLETPALLELEAVGLVTGEIARRLSRPRQLLLLAGTCTGPDDAVEADGHAFTDDGSPIDAVRLATGPSGRAGRPNHYERRATADLPDNAPSAK
jgi:hypothetical protein